MVTVYDVSASALVGKASEKLKEISEIAPPKWLAFAKTGPHVERAPSEKDFWYKRCASLMRNIYIHGESGVNRFRTHYGGRKNRGSRPEHHVDAGGSAIRKALQQLEKAGFVKKGKAGRELTPKGRAFLDSAAKDSKR
ncbi:MAG: 30S ribosomal protein S19e [Candidatus Micrarchaeota archaeon]